MLCGKNGICLINKVHSRALGAVYQNKSEMSLPELLDMVLLQIYYFKYFIIVMLSKYNITQTTRGLFALCYIYLTLR